MILGWWRRRRKIRRQILRAGDLKARLEQEQKLEAAKKATPSIKRDAAKIAKLSTDELAERMRRAFMAGG